ncbi:MAG: type IV pilus modification protein PilV [Deltaproteobacteria bacterium]|nr:type IV pilus modification protein PilV [Deltaproteobacteria bacterium]
MKTVGGFTLLEILVALLIISVGLLGLAGLQGKGLRDNQSALLRSRAVQCCEDILDRMRVNRNEAVDGSYNIVDLTKDTSLSTSYQQMVRTDLMQWQGSQLAQLPEGKGTLSVSSNVATVTVSWSEAEGLQTMTVKTRL